MATPEFAPGYNAPVTFTPTSGGAGGALRVKGWNWEESVVDIDTSHTGSSGVEERLAGLGRGKGDCSLIYDLGNPHHDAPYVIRAGTKGTFLFFVRGTGTTKYYTVPAMILSVGNKSVVDGAVEVQVSVGLSSDVGTYSRPS